MSQSIKEAKVSQPEGIFSYSNQTLYDEKSQKVGEKMVFHPVVGTDETDWFMLERSDHYKVKRVFAVISGRSCWVLQTSPNDLQSNLNGLEQSFRRLYPKP